jgi:hypothetical protein
VILSVATTVGFIDIDDRFVFAQPFGAITDGSGMRNFACFENAVDSGVCDLFFVKKRVEVSIPISGVTLSNLALLEDINFPECNVVPLETCVAKPQSGVYTAQSQAFAFGDLIEISGQTPSGITVTGRTGICFQNKSNLIKKHFFIGTVNPDCVEGAQTPSPKPPLFFDFESLSIEGVPLAADILMSTTVFCSQPTYACTFGVSLTFSGAVIFNPITLSLSFSTVTGPFTFGGLSLSLPAGVATITITFDAAFNLTSITASLNATINPDTKPGTLTATVTLIPGTGLTSMTLRLAVTRSGLTFSAVAAFSGTPVVLTRVTFNLSAAAGVVTLRSAVTYSLVSNTLSGSLSALVNF